MGCEGGCEMPRARYHKVDCILGRDMFKNDLKSTKLPEQGNQHAIDEDAFTVEDIHLWIDHLAMHEQRDPVLLHRAEHWIDHAQIGHAVLRMRSRTGGIILGGMGKTTVLGAPDLGRGGIIREIEGHQWLKAAIPR